jgi:DNA modification methylase
MSIIERSFIRGVGINIERLPTNTTTKYHPFHRWFNFIAGFSPEYVDLMCNHISDNKKILLDPFSGCGTSLVQAYNNGFEVVGYEAHPFFYQISLAKLILNINLDDISMIKNAIQKGLKNGYLPNSKDNSSIVFLKKLIPENYLKALYGAKTELEINNLNNNPLAILILSKLLNDCSHSATDGIYKVPTSKKKSIDPILSLQNICNIIQNDIDNYHKENKNKKIVYNKSSENMNEIKNNSISLIVTSPPYLNNFDYAEMTRMYLYFWGIANNWSEITDKVRSKLVINTTTALKGQKNIQNIYKTELPNCLHKKLDAIVISLQEKRKQKSGKKDYYLMIYPYFAQMNRILSECFRVIKPNGLISIMIADSALYGEHIETHKILAEIMEYIGFSNISVKQIRVRGGRWLLEKREGSPNGLGEYCILASKES